MEPVKSLRPEDIEVRKVPLSTAEFIICDSDPTDPCRNVSDSDPNDPGI